MPDYPPLAAFDFEQVCNCRRISRRNLKTAMDESQGMVSGDTLYDAAHDQRLQDIFDGTGGLITGLETNVTGYNCTRPDGLGGNCKHLFDEAASYLNGTKRLIPIASLTPRIGECGNDCNTCSSAQTDTCAPGPQARL